MNKTKSSKTKKLSTNIFEGGGVAEVITPKANPSGAIFGALGTTANIVGNAMTTANAVQSLDPIRNNLVAMSNPVTNFSSTDDFLSYYNNRQAIPTYTSSDFTNVTKGSAATSALQSATSGMGAGATLGSAIMPGIGTAIGAVGGAVLGGVASLFGSNANRIKAEKNAEIANQLAQNAEARLAASDLNAISNIEANRNFNILANMRANGGQINIDPKNKGKFTAAAKARGMGVQEFASKVLANKEDYSPLMVKRANFARNAAHWNADGGPLFSDFTNGVTIVGNGGTHEQNPNDGVQIGIAPDGKPNLVEEGEVIFNNYVFSNRLKVPKDVKKKYKLKGETFADAFKAIQKESEERPNDPISKDGLNNMAMILAGAQEELRVAKDASNNKFATGGPYIPYDRNYSDFNSLYAENSPYMQAINYYNDPANTALRDSLISRINSGEFGTLNGVNVTPDNWYDYATDFKKGPVHNALLDAANNWINRQNAPLAGNLQTTKFTINPTDTATGIIGNAGNYDPSVEGPFGVRLLPRETALEVPALPQIPSTDGTTSKNVGDPNLSWLRYAELLPNIAAVTSDILGKTNTPTTYNYITPYTDIQAATIGDYVQSETFDRNWWLNQMLAQQAGTRRALSNTSSPSSAANILAADYNAGLQLGQLARQGQEYNREQALRTAEFNRGTNQFNAQMLNQVADTNARNRLAYNQALLQQARLNEEDRNDRLSARLMNVQSLGRAIADVGRESDAKNWRNMLLRSGVYGTLSEKPSGWSDNQWSDYLKSVYNISADGGKIKTKKKKGLTY